MQMRRLGSQGLHTSAIGYGSIGTAVGYGPTDDVRSISAIRRAHDLGVTMFDTAEMYGWGSGEELLGRSVAPFRDEVVIATKFGLTRGFGPDSRPDHIREVVESGLRRLGVDHIDVLYQHRPDPAVPIEDVVSTMAEFVEAGKVRFLGLSEAGPDDLRRAHATAPISVLQTEYSLFARDAEPLFPLLDELDIGFVAYSPLARGFLTGTATSAETLARDDSRAHMPWWQPENFEANSAIVRELERIATGKGISVSQLALAWILTAHDHIVPIPGSRDPDRVAHNVAATEVQLDEDDIAAIEAVVPDGAHGHRGTDSPWLRTARRDG